MFEGDTLFIPIAQDPGGFTGHTAIAVPETSAVGVLFQEVTVAGNLKEIFLNISAIGNDHLARSSLKVGSLLIDSMTVGGD